MLLRYFHTLRYLRLDQIYWRIYYKIFTPKPNLSLAPTLRLKGNDWIVPAKRSVRMLGKNKFKFLNDVHVIDDKLAWNKFKQSKLWIYNFHYFDDLNSTDAGLRTEWHKEQINNWIINNPPGMGDGWEAYPLSLRIVNWIKWAQSGHILEEHWLDSLAIQIRYLNKSIERHLLGNHLFSNAKALIFSGVFFKGSEATHWYDVGIEIIKRELPEQVLSDGGNFELSTMYHSIFLEDLLDIFNLCNSYSRDIPANVNNIIPKMLYWLNVMLHPDKEISLFNDAAFDIAPSPKEIFDYAARLGFECNKLEKKINYLEDSGYVRVDCNSAVAFIDVARIGPDYLPAHGHADTLTFELSLFGERVIVNSGTSVYGASIKRLNERGTKAHNTVVIDEKNSSDVWSGFRVARRARPYNVKVQKIDEAVKVRASHSGYKVLPGKPIHSRTWVMNEQNFKILDFVHGGNVHSIESIFHLHPDIKVDIVNANEYTLLTKNKFSSNIKFNGFDKLELVEFDYHPEFGKSCSSLMFCGSVINQLPVNLEIIFSW